LFGDYCEAASLPFEILRHCERNAGVLRFAQNDSKNKNKNKNKNRSNSNSKNKSKNNSKS